MHKTLLTICTLIVLFSVALAHATTSPDTVVRELYRVHNNGRGQLFSAKSKQKIYRFFDKKLADLLWKDFTDTPKGDVGNLDFDPLFNAQDMKITQFQIGRGTVEGNKAVVPVTFKNFGKQNTIKFQMVNADNVWKVENIVYDDKSDLMKILNMPQ